MLILSLMVLSLAAMPAESPPTAVTYPASRVAVVPIKHNHIDVFATSRTDVTKPQKRDQFVYSPGWIPETDDSGRVRVKGPVFLPSGKYQMSLTLVLASEDLAGLVLDAITHTIPEYEELLTTRNVSVWPTKWVSLQLPDEAEGQFKVRLSRTQWNISGANTLTVNFLADDEAAAQAFVDRIGELALDIRYAATASRTVQNEIRITAKTVKNAPFFAALDGGDSSEVFVRRHVLQEALEELGRRLDIVRRLERPEMFGEMAVNQLLHQLDATTVVFDAERGEFNAVKWDALYDPNDLKTIVLTDVFSKVYTFDEHTKHFVLKNDVDAQAKVSLAEFLGGEAHLKHKFSYDDFLKIVAKRDVTLHKQGTMYVPKSLSLVQINKAVLRQLADLSWVDLVIEEPADYETKGLVQVGAAAQEAAALIGRNTLRKARQTALQQQVRAGEKGMTLTTKPEAVWNAKGRQLLNTFKTQFTAAEQKLAHSEELSEDLPSEASAGFKAAKLEFLAASAAADECLRGGIKRRGWITGYDWSITLGHEDKEKEVHMAIRLPNAPPCNPGTGQHWGDKAHASGTVTDLHVAIDNDVELHVGIENEARERNCRVDAQFTVTLKYEDETGKKWESTHQIGETQWSTDGKGLGASHLISIAKVNRLQFAD